MNGAAPASVFAGEELGQLAELRSIPMKTKNDGSFLQGGCALPGPIDPELPGVAEVEVGANRLSLETHPPDVFRVLPECVFGVGDGKGFLLGAVLEVDAAVVGLDVGERGMTLRTGLACRRDGDAGSALQKILDVPAAVVPANEI